MKTFQEGKLQDMELWSRVCNALKNERPSSTNEIVHDYTFTFNGHTIKLIKLLADGWAFLVGEGTVKSGDVVLVKTPALTTGIGRFRIETVQHQKDNVWRAYARLEASPVKPKARLRLAFKR